MNRIPYQRESVCDLKWTRREPFLLRVLDAPERAVGTDTRTGPIDEAAVRELTCGYNDWSRRQFTAVYTRIEPDALGVYERGGEWFVLMYRTDTGWFLMPIEPPEEE